MKRKMSLLVVLALVLALMVPCVAMAADDFDFTKETDDTSDSTDRGQTYTWKWDGFYGILTLNGAKIDKTVILPTGSTIVLEGENKITGDNKSGIVVESSASAVGDFATLTIRGTGSLTVQGENGGSNYSVGINLANLSGSGYGILTVESGTVEAIGGAPNSNNSYGIDGGVILNGGTLTAKGGETTGGYSSYGIGREGSGAENTITVNGGTLIATGHTNALAGYLTVKNGTIKGSRDYDDSNPTLEVTGDYNSAVKVDGGTDAAKTVRMVAGSSTSNTYTYYYNEQTPIEAPKTFDAGVAMYVGMAVMSVTGMAYVGKKKF